MNGQQSIRTYFASDIRAMVRTLYLARPDLFVAWMLMLQMVGYDDPMSELPISQLLIDQN